ncbi:MAG: hypothetical protein WA840_18215, partial [Caulobacteraceae bacterium]
PAPRTADVSRGEVLHASRGEVLLETDHAALVWLTSILRRAMLGWRFWALVAMLPLAGQSFQYIVDVLPAYALTKIWPLIILPMAFWAFGRLHPPYRLILLATMFWAFAITPLIGVFELGDSIVSAVSTTAKVWSLTTALSTVAMFAALRTRPEDLTRAVMGWGATTFVMMTVLWFVVPRSAYDNGLNETKLFLADIERGYRIYMPMFFGLLTVFALNRSFWMRPKLWKPLAVAVCFVLLVTIFKQRTMIAGAALVVILGGVLSFPRWRIPILAGMVVLLLLAAPALWAYAHSAALAKSLGGSLSNRQMEIAKGLEFLNAEPHRWLFGAGAATRVGDVSLADIVGAPGFFLADLGWLGVFFEYGSVGVLLLLLLHLAGLRITWRAARLGDPVARATFDYVLYIVLISPIVPVTFAPGELCTCMAMAFWYLRTSPEPTPGPASAEPLRG